ncbi:MAG: site-2 protease family protein [Candidatus Polarisedimenticolia bacterium]
MDETTGAGRSGPPPTIPPPQAWGGGAIHPPAPRPFPWINLILFALTVGSTLVAGTLMTLDDYRWATVVDVLLQPAWWGLGLPYAGCLVLILGSHEMGHYLACRHYRIDATLPYFIPGPPYFGTFGAVIRIRAPITDRRALFDIGVAGPIAGFVVAVPVLIYGLTESRLTRLPPRAGDLYLSSCLLMDLLVPRFFPGTGADETLRLHPTFVAGWVGLLATGLNLLPMGQLDGGHVLYALTRRGHAVVSRIAIAVLILAGILFGGLHLVVFGVVFAVIGPRHPATLDDRIPPGPFRLLVALGALLMLVLCLIVRTPAILGS